MPSINWRANVKPHPAQDINPRHWNYRPKFELYFDI
jgi:hypothetical protein